MDADLSTTGSLERQPSHGYASSGSESKRPSGSSGKKRASRAGTRSVTTLSAAQLERKRANDREAQRAIRQRTKDHIDILERTVSELRGTNESSEKIVAVTRQRNFELEEENTFLRSRLNDAAYRGADTSDVHGLSEPSAVSAHATSPATALSTTGSSIQRPSSTSSPRSLSVTTASQSSNSRHSSFQQMGQFPGSAPSSLLPVSSSSTMTTPTALTAWRSHDGIPSAQVPQTQQASAYHLADSSSRPEWVPTTQHYQYSSAAVAQRPQQYEQHQAPPGSASGMAQHYVQTPVMPYTPMHAPTIQQQQPYHPPQLPPQSEFQNMAVSSPAAYNVPPYPPGQPQQAYATQPQPQSYQQQPASLQTNPVQMSPAGSVYSPAHSQMQPPPLPPTSYAPMTADRQYAPQQLHPPLQYPQDAASHGYSLTHYPSG
ncbi:hypothetical protein LTR78_007386 [Recurvomyces mirabilis]|uniref:BZIP domain-containing protein n=1 Tax=Recurvomyces mirabilis TaxID=574656 RepID=A0AAE0WJE5_9PEZI|nr:hypothetical protein LTR78_007386 [Recurvomyces mirabilis]KAK5155026.1 hypothetical protein LTS14_005981 [Recurvomyces mirabilis]